MRVKTGISGIVLVVSLGFSPASAFAEDGSGAPRSIELSEDLSIADIGRDAYLVTHRFPWPGNSLLVRLNEESLLWIDTPYTPEATALVLDWAYGKFGSGIRVVEINTGFHIDNLGGNEELVRRGIPVYGSDRTCELLRTRSAATMRVMGGWLATPAYERYRDVYARFVFVEPTVRFDIREEQRLEFAGDSVRVYFPGPTHSYDNTVVYVPKLKLLFGGCMILSAKAKKLGYIADGDVEEWAASLRKVASRFGTAEIVVPGHGEIGGFDLIAHTLELVETESASR